MEDVPSKFRYGAQILYRELVEHSHVIDVKPVTVVEDSDERIALWLPLGTPTKKPVLLKHIPSTPRDWVKRSWALVDSIWQWAELLIGNGQSFLSSFARTNVVQLGCDGQQIACFKVGM